MITVQI